MANLRDNNYHNLRFRINKDEYWDFFVNHDSYGIYTVNSGLSEDCLISYINACFPECISGNTWMYSTSAYTWEDSLAIDNTLYNITYTGTDNGLFQFKKDRISNKDFWELYQNNSFRIDEDDYRLKLHAVSGNTQLYEYPLTVENCQIKLNGGFYQGFFKTECDKYYILPSNLDDTPWEFEFELKKCDLEPESNKTLNDKYPDNKGIFFYIGTRAENKWLYYYDNDDEYSAQDECNAIGQDNYVEDAEINPNDHIIGNFYDMEFEEFYVDDDVNTDNYINYNYYDPSYYENPCDSEFGLQDFIDFIPKPTLIDELLPHEVIGCYCCNSEESTSKKAVQTRTFFRACACTGCGCKRTPIKREDPTPSQSDDECPNYMNWVVDDGVVDYGDFIDDYDYIEPELNITDFDYQTTNGFSLTTAGDTYIMTDNKFIMFDRTCDGMTVRNWIDGTQMMLTSRKSRFNGNLFILMNRTCTGYTVRNIDELRTANDNVYDDIYNDLYNNAFALRITDDGSIGYRMLTYDCEISGDNKTSIIEGYSFSGAIPDCEWCTIHVKIVPSLDKMKLYFYVNGKLKYVTADLPKLDLHALGELYEKQEGVPYNISIGGGTQGLAETILSNYMMNPTRVYPIEEYFAGSFIGYFKSFKFYNCGLGYRDIVNNYKYEKTLLNEI